MDAELAQLAATGAGTLVKLMATDLWGTVKAGFGRIFGGDELESSRAELIRAKAEGDGELVAELEEGWRLRLRGLLRSDPAFAGQLRALLQELDPATASTGQVINVHNTFSGGTVHGTVIQAGTISGLTKPGEDAR